MVRIKMLFARIAIIVFAVVAAFYSLYVSSMGRVNVSLGDPEGLVHLLSGLAASMGREGIADMLSRLKSWDMILAALLFASVCLGGELCFQGGKRADLRRRAVRLITPALIVISVLWVLFRLNNTSLFAWSQYIRGNHGFPLFGTARGIRRDEFSLWTPMALSQEYLGWPAVNTLIGNGADVTWVSMGGLPAWNAALPFKPLYWGFLLLGAERGLSFLCISRLVLLFIVSRKTALLYTRNNQAMSFAAAVILTLSPMVQWFISQSIAEILIFGQGMILAVNGLLNSTRTRTMILFALLNSWLLGCLVMVGYPAWIIPAMYIIIAVGICQFSRSSVRNRKKKAGVLFLGLLPSLALLGIIVYSSWDTLQAVRSSIYPGHRLITGGLSDSIAITGEVWNPAFKVDLASIFFPLGTIDFTASNPVDASTFLGFAPAGLVLSVWHQWRERKADPLAIVIISILAFFWLFTFIELPAWFCKLTLLSQCSRPVFPIGLCEIFLLIRARARGGIRNPQLAAVAAGGSTAFNIACILYFRIVQPGTLQLLILTAVYLAVFFFIYFDFHGSGTRLTAFFLCCVLLLAGGFVNPIQAGLDMLDNFTLVRTLKSIENEPDDLYALEGDYPSSEVPLLAGKHCINTDQPYADMERWSAIDPERRFEDVYNRLCHVAVNLVDSEEQTWMKEEGNRIILWLTRDDLSALGVNYLITPRDSLEHASLAAFDEEDGLYVWKLE